MSNSEVIFSKIASKLRNCEIAIETLNPNRLSYVTQRLKFTNMYIFISTFQAVYSMYTIIVFANRNAHYILQCNVACPIYHAI